MIWWLHRSEKAISGTNCGVPVFNIRFATDAVVAVLINKTSWYRVAAAMLVWCEGKQDVSFEHLLGWTA